MIHWKPKRFIDKWIDEMTLTGHAFLQPKQCFELLQQEYPLTENEVWEYFFQLVTEGQLIGVAGVSCSHEENDKNTPSLLYQKESIINDDGNIMIDIQDVMDTTLTCPECNKSKVVTQKEVWISFSPTSEYKKILKEEVEKEKPNRQRLTLMQ